MISLCGSPPDGFFQIIEIGLITLSIFLFYVHYKAYKSQYYNEEYVYFSTGRKFLIYIGFLAISLCITPVVILISFFIYAGLFK